MKPRFSSLAAGLALGCTFALQAQAQVVARPVPGTVVAPTAPQPMAVPPQRWTAQQLNQAFTAADADGNNQLSRAEAQQLVILPRSFEDLDQNKDGVLTRSEYESIGGAS